MVNRFRYPMNSGVSVFFILEGGIEIRWFQGEVFRIIWEGNRARTILRTLWTFGELVNDFPNGCTITLNEVSCGRRDVFNPGEIMLRLDNCEIRRRWMVSPSAFVSDDTDVVRITVEISSDIEVYHQEWVERTTREWEAEMKRKKEYKERQEHERTRFSREAWNAFWRRS